MQTDNILKYIIYTLVGVLFLIPFVMTPDHLFPFITGKAFMFRAVAASIFFVWLALAVRNSEYRPRFSLILASVTTFIIMIGVSNAFGENPFSSFWSNYERMEGYVNLLHLFGMFLAVGSVIRTREDWNKFIMTSFIISIGVLYSALQQHFGYKEISQGGRLDARFGNPIYLAVYNIFHIFFGLYLISAKDFLKDNWYKISIGAIVLIHLFVLYQTNTRGAVLGLLAGVFLIGLLNALTIKKESKKIWLASVMAVVIILVSVVGFIAVKDSDFVRNNKVLGRFAEISLTSGTSEARILNWGIATEGFKERPILGWGMGNYSYVFDKYYDPRMYGNESWFDHVHNIVLDWLIAGGVVGLILFLLILGALVWAIFTNKKYSHLERNIFIGLVAAYFVQNLFVFDNQVGYIYLFLILAMFHSMSNREISIFTGNMKKEVADSLAVFFILLLPVTIYFVNAPAYFASKTAISALRDLAALQQKQQQITPEQAPKIVEGIIDKIKKSASYNSFASLEIRSKAVFEPAFTLVRLPATYLSNEAKQEYVQFALDEFSKEVDKNPNDAKTNYIFGIYLSQLGDHANAQKFLQKATELSPNKQVLMLPLAFNYLRLEQNDLAIETAKRAYEISGEDKIEQKYDALWIDYARLVSVADKDLAKEIIDEEISAGRIQRVEKFLLRIIELNPENPQAHINLSVLYFRNGDVEKSLEVLEKAKEKLPNSATQFSALIAQIKAGANPAGLSF